MTKTAWSLVRYSSARQGDGTSEERQDEFFENWLKRNPDFVAADKKFIGRGQSAYHQVNLAEGGCLRQFLDDLNSPNSPIKSGDVLVVEFQNRLVRCEPLDALDIVRQIVKRGVTIATARGEINKDSVKSGMLHTVLALAQSDYARSDDLSKWAKKGWELRRKDKKQPLPHWLDADGSLNLDKAESIRKIVELAIGGWGANQLVSFAQANLTPVAKSGHWTTAYISVLIRDRRLIGEMQPCEQKKKVDSNGSELPGKPQVGHIVGDAVKDYFPAVLSENTFAQLQAAVDSRNRQGSSAKRTHLNLLAGLINGFQIHVQHDKRRNKDYKSLRLSVAVDKIRPNTPFNYNTFETAIIKMIREITPADLYPTIEVASVVGTLEGELAKVEQFIAQLKIKMSDPELIGLYDKAYRDAIKKQQSLAAELQRAKACNPPEIDLDAAQSIVDDSESNRLALRAALRRLIGSIDLVVKDKRAFATVNFKSGVKRRIVVEKDGSYGLWREAGEQYSVEDLAAMLKSGEPLGMFNKDGIEIMPDKETTKRMVAALAN